MLSAFGPGPAQHIAVSGAVLIFFWGAFAYVRSCARPCRRKAPWHLVICLAMLAYGWVFHMGLFNFYISLGLSFGALALACRRRWWGMTAAVPLLAFAYVAHALPVGWAAGALMYGWIGRRLAPRHRWWLLAGALLSLGGVAFILCSRYGGEWATGQWSRAQRGVNKPGFSEYTTSRSAWRCWDFGHSGFSGYWKGGERLVPSWTYGSSSVCSRRRAWSSFRAQSCYPACTTR